jgi:hypothetical protein
MHGTYSLSPTKSTYSDSGKLSTIPSRHLTLMSQDPLEHKMFLDHIASQLDLKEEDFDDLLIPVAGDQLTVNNIRKLKTYTSTDCTIYSQYSWTLPWIQLWHMKWAALRSIFQAHWSGEPGKGLCGLHTDCQTLRRKHINPGKCDFYIHTDLVFDTFEVPCALVHCGDYLPLFCITPHADSD